MSKRRKTGDWVYLRPFRNAEKCEPWEFHAQIIPLTPSWGCTNSCGDSECMEWHTLFSEPDPTTGLCTMHTHINECEMFDEPQV